MSFAAAHEVLGAAEPSQRNLEALTGFLVQQNLTKLDKTTDKWAVRVVSRLFTLFESPQTPQPVLEAVSEAVRPLLADSQFFVRVFRAVEPSNPLCWELLQLVYQALFSVIPDTSRLVVDWMEILVSNKLLARLDESERALALLVTVQFLNVTPAFTRLTGYRRNHEIMAKLHPQIQKLHDPTVNLVWALVLHKVALGYMAEPDPALVEGFMEPHLHARDGVQFDFVARDVLVPALEAGGHRGLLQTLDVLDESERYSQTVGDVLVTLLEVCKPTHAICIALRRALSPFPSLQSDFWKSQHAREALALAKAKCPASLNALVELARCVPDVERAHELDTMNSYVTTVPAESVDIMTGGDDVRANGPLELLSARPTDGQGALVVDPATPGTLLNAGPPLLVQWRFMYSGWSLFGRILENYDLFQGDNWDSEKLSALDLITETVGSGDNILVPLSQGLVRGDFVELVTLRLASWLRKPQNPICVHGVRFLSAVSRVDSDRIAPIARELAPAIVGCGQPELVLAVLDLVRPYINEIWCVRFVLDVWQSFLYWAGDLTSELRHRLLDIVKNLDLSDQVMRELMDTRSTAAFVASLSDTETLDVCVRLIRRRIELGMTLSRFEQALYAHSHDLVDLLSRLPCPVLRVLTEIVAGAQPETPLLAFLGSERASALADRVVGLLNSGLEPDRVVQAGARFFAAVARSHQQGLFVLLSEGVLPALYNLVRQDLSSEARAAVLDALAAADGRQALPPTAPFAVLADFVQKTTKFDTHNDYVAVAAAVDVLRHANADSDGLVKESRQLTLRFVAVPELRLALHDLLARNWAAKWPQIPSDAPLPDLDRVLANDPMWAGFRTDLLEARANLDLTKARTRVVTAWCAWLAAKASEKKNLSGCSLALLEANDAPYTPIFGDLFVVRAETAFYILRQGVDPGSGVVQVAVRQLAEEQPADVRRTLLRIINCVLRMSQEKVPNSLLLEVLDVGVVRATRTLCITAGASGGSGKYAHGHPDDLREALAALRQCLVLLGGPGNPTVAPLCQAMVDAGADRALTRLYSTATPSQPLIGELALQHIHEWLPVGIMADHFAGHGFLTVLAEAPLSRLLQDGGVTSHKNPDMHSMWRRGILPVLLRLVSLLGGRIVQEAALIVEAFGPQLTTCLEEWRSPQGRVGLALVEETVLIHALVTLLGDPQFFPAQEVIVAIDHLSTHRKYLATRVVDDEAQVLDEMADLRWTIERTLSGNFERGGRADAVRERGKLLS